MEPFRIPLQATPDNKTLVMGDRQHYPPIDGQYWVWPWHVNEAMASPFVRNDSLLMLEPPQLAVIPEAPDPAVNPAIWQTPETPGFWDQSQGSTAIPGHVATGATYANRPVVNPPGTADAGGPAGSGSGRAPLSSLLKQ